MAATVLMGTVFIAGQAYEWLELMHEGSPPSRRLRSTFYISPASMAPRHRASLHAPSCSFATTGGDLHPTRHLFAETSMLYCTSSHRLGRSLSPAYGLRHPAPKIHAVYLDRRAMFLTSCAPRSSKAKLNLSSNDTRTTRLTQTPPARPASAGALQR